MTDLRTHYKFKLTSTEIVFIILAVILMVGHAIYCNSFNASKSVIALSGLSIIAFLSLVFFYYFLKFKDYKKDWIFLAALIGLGIVFCFIFPPATVPDEIHHFESSYLYANGLSTLGTRTLIVRADDAAFISGLSQIINQANYQSTLNHLVLFVTNTDPVSITTVASFPISSNPPQVRIAPALGILIGKILGLSSLLTFYLGRFFNLALYIVLVFWPIAQHQLVKTSLLQYHFFPCVYTWLHRIHTMRQFWAFLLC